jgi:hypothetical protein
MRNLRLGVLGIAVFAAACASLNMDSPGRPNSVTALKSTQQAQPKDPHDFVTDPTIGSNPPPASAEKPLCRLECGPGTHCDASGLVERCVSDEKPKP